MTIIEEKKSILINRIQQTDDEELLDMLNDISTNNKVEFHISGELIDIIEKIDNDMNNGEFYTSEEMENIIDSWN